MQCEASLMNAIIQNTFHLTRCLCLLNSTLHLLLWDNISEIREYMIICIEEKYMEEVGPFFAFALWL